MDRQVTLFVNHYSGQTAERSAEIDYCLAANAANPGIHCIVVIAQSAERPKAPDKVLWVPMDCSRNPYVRPTFGNFFDLVNQAAVSPADINVVANSDIIFDATLSLLLPLDLDGVCLALARWDHDHEGNPAVTVGDDAQDVWIFQGKVKPVKDVDYPMGITGCDWRLAWELKEAGYRLMNPCYDIRAQHHHKSGVRNNGLMIRGPRLQSIPRTTLAACALKELSMSPQHGPPPGSRPANTKVEQRGREQYRSARRLHAIV
jgi:hypothetical protein